MKLQNIREETMSVLQSLVEIEMMSDEEIKSKFETSRSNVRKVLKVLLIEELTKENKKDVIDEPDGETQVGMEENRKKRRSKRSEMKDIVETQETELS